MNVWRRFAGLGALAVIAAACGGIEQEPAIGAGTAPARPVDVAPQRDAINAAHSLRRAGYLPHAQLQGSTIAIVPYLDREPITGGERNLKFFVHGLKELHYDVGVLAWASPLQRMYQGEGIKVLAPPTLRVPARHLKLFCAQANNLHDFVNAEVDRLHRAQQSGRHLAEGSASFRRQVGAAMARLEAMSEPRDEALVEVPMVRHDFGSLIPRALQLRQAARQHRVKVFVIDLMTDAVAATVGLMGTDSHSLYYTQLTSAERPDGFVGAYGQVATCGHGVRQARFPDEVPVAVVPNGINADLFRPRASGDEIPPFLLPRGRGPLRIGNVAHLADRKNQLALVRACVARKEDLGDFDLFFIGDAQVDGSGERVAKEVTAAAAAGGLAHHVHLVGSKEKMEEILPHLDLFVFPSRQEGMPLSVLEAMSCGVAVLLSEIDGTRELRGPGVTFFSLGKGPGSDSRAEQELAAALVRLAQDPVARRRQGEEARRRIDTGAHTQRRMLRSMAQAISAVSSGLPSEALDSRRGDGDDADTTR